MAESAPRLIVGLGNPGPRYAGNRHNIGFMVVEELARRRGLVFGPAEPSYRAAGDDGLVLLQPLTYMNRSGGAVRAWSRDAGWPVTGAPVEPAGTSEAGPGAETPASSCVPEPAPSPEAADQPPAVRPLVVCDDLALPLGAVRLRARGSSGGQNGLASILEELGGEEVPRLRLGVAPEGGVDPADWADYVLEDFGPGERDAVTELVAYACDTLDRWLEDGLEAAASRGNRRRGPPAD
jgi:PTH1 family peptidyl-tRNA hydrolase